jgi:tRNA modification GTPase
LDHALLLWFPGPATATGEDLAELHLHGGRAVVAATLAALSAAGLRLAEPGEFTRRALLNGRLDLSAVEGLADLLAAETDSQRKEALRRADGLLARKLEGWAKRLIAIAARIEAAIDYDGEMEVEAGQGSTLTDLHDVLGEVDGALAVPPAERLRDGLRVAIIGPPNAGKSTLFNALVGRDAAIVSDTPGTTRDAIERPISIRGMPFILVDTAGLRETSDPIERIGVERARNQQSLADIVLDLTSDSATTPSVIAVAAKSDIEPSRPGALRVSALTGEGLGELHNQIAVLGACLLPGEGEVALDQRYRESLYSVREELATAAIVGDPLLCAEHVRLARETIDSLTGSAGIEDMLDALFGRFCLGK